MLGKTDLERGGILMTDGKRITYRDIMDLEREMMGAPELPREEREVKDRKEAVSLLNKGILAYLKKGYSIQAVVETVNAKFPEFEINESDVRKILPKVTRKKRAAAVKENSGAGKKPGESDGLYSGDGSWDGSNRAN
jgi:hypothetical protein